MNPIVLEWVQKAEGDYNIVEREWRPHKNQNFDAVCFHAQQSVEKYLKAVLEDLNQPFNKTHDLAYLLNKLPPYKANWVYLLPKLNILTTCAVDIRYPGSWANKQMAREARDICREARRVIRLSLNLP